MARKSRKNYQDFNFRPNSLVSEDKLGLWTPPSSNHSTRWLDGMSLSNQGNLLSIREAQRMVNSFDKGFFGSKEEFEYIMYLHEREYWTNFFYFVDKDTKEPVKELENIKPYIISAFWTYSAIGIRKVDDTFLIYYLSNIKENFNREIAEANGTYWLLNGQGLGEKEQQEQNELNFAKLTSDKCVLVKSGIEYKPWYFGSKMLWDRLYDRIDWLDNNCANSKPIKAIQSESLSENKEEEISQFAYGGKKFFLYTGSLDKITDISLGNTADKGWADFWEMWNLMLIFRGMRGNISEKAARNTTSEVVNDTISFYVIENAKRRVLQYIADKMNEIYGMNLEVITVLELEQRREDSIELSKFEEKIEIENKIKAKYEVQEKKADTVQKERATDSYKMNTITSVPLGQQQLTQEKYKPRK